MHTAWDGDRIVGGAGAFTYQLSVPGGSVPAGGVTVVGVLPTHRRRGVLRSLMKAQLEDCRARGESAAYLWASEATIYGRFGYGLASRIGEMTLARDRAAFAVPFTPRGAFACSGSKRPPSCFRRSTSRSSRSGRGRLRAARRGGRRASSPTTPPAGVAARCTALCSSSTASRPATRSTGCPGLGVRVQQGNGDDPGGRDPDP